MKLIKFNDFEEDKLNEGSDLTAHQIVLNNLKMYDLENVANDDNLKTELAKEIVNDLKLNLEIIENKIVSEATFHPRILIDFNMYSEYSALVCRRFVLF